MYHINLFYFVCFVCSFICFSNIQFWTLVGGLGLGEKKERDLTKDTNPHFYSEFSLLQHFPHQHSIPKPSIGVWNLTLGKILELLLLVAESHAPPATPEVCPRVGPLSYLDISVEEAHKTPLWWLSKGGQSWAPL